MCVNHAVPRNRHVIGAGTIALLVSSAMGLSSQVLVAQLSPNARPTRIIGAADGSVEEAFGFIGDVEVSSAGEVFVLDRLAYHIAWFGPDGHFVARIGREGSGPGEFRKPLVMALDDDKRLHVYDESSRRITVYAVSSGSAVHVTDQRMANHVRGICVIGNRRFVLTPDQPLVLQELDGNGLAIRSFGPREEPPSDVLRKVRGQEELARTYYNVGLLACDARSGTVAIAHEYVPTVRLFSIDGRQLWNATLEDFRGRILGISPRGGFSFRPDPRFGVSHAASAIAFTPSGHLVVTLWEGGASNREGRLEARVLAIADGKRMDRYEPPARLTIVGSDRSFAFLQHPHPMVLIY